MKWLLMLGISAAMLLQVSQPARAGELPAVGEAAPYFSLPDQDGKIQSLKDYEGKWLVLYFYPRDDTPSCTQEACAFRDDMNKLTALGAQIVGISVDSQSSHAQFAGKYHLPFPLLSDDQAEVAERYGVLRNMLLFRFARRYTFLIDPQGKIRKVYDKVETSRHSKEIIADLKLLEGDSQSARP
jgi:thioredoxin-dependent peroxiredoxin